MSTLPQVEYLRQDRTQPQVQAAIDQSQSNGHSFALVERAAYWSFQGYTLEFVVTPGDLDTAMAVIEPLKKNTKVSDAGYAAMNVQEQSDPTENLQQGPGSRAGPGVGPEIGHEAAPWMLWLLIDRGIDEYWSFIMPAVLNMIDSSNTTLKIAGAKLAACVADKRPEKLRKTGLVPVFQSALTLLLSYLPPSTDPVEAAAINGATQAAMLRLASCRQEYNTLAIRAFAALEHARGHIEFTRSVLQSLINLVSKMQLLAVAHLRQIINIFNAVAGDPFADMSPELLGDAALLMTTTMQVCAPRVPQYRYNILLGVTKGKLWDNQVSNELAKYLSPEEMVEARETLKSLQA